MSQSARLDRLTALPYHTVLLVAHEETLRVLTVLTRGLRDEAMPEMEFGNCEVITLSLP